MAESCPLLCPADVRHEDRGMIALGAIHDNRVDIHPIVRCNWVQVGRLGILGVVELRRAQYNTSPKNGGAHTYKQKEQRHTNNTPTHAPCFVFDRGGLCLGLRWLGTAIASAIARGGLPGAGDAEAAEPHTGFDRRERELPSCVGCVRCVRWIGSARQPRSMRIHFQYLDSIV